MSTYQSVTEDIYQALKAGRKLIVANAHEFRSSQTAFPRRIMDIEKKHDIKVLRSKIKVSESRSPISQYYLNLNNSNN